MESRGGDGSSGGFCEVRGVQGKCEGFIGADAEKAKTFRVADFGGQKFSE